MSLEKAAERAAARRRGMGEEAAHALKDKVLASGDSYARCPRCGATFRGDLPALREAFRGHPCGGA